MENQTMLFFPAFQPLDHGAALKIERKMSHLNIAFDRYASLGTVLHYILVISFRSSQCAHTSIVPFTRNIVRYWKKWNAALNIIN